MNMEIDVGNCNESLLRDQVVEFFADAVKVLGLPKSVGELYGLLFISKEALSLDDMVEKLGMSLEGRKVFYEADVELKSLVGGFIREEVRPHLNSAKEKIESMDKLGLGEDEFYAERLHKLDSWRKRARFVLPIIQKLLGR